MSVKTAMQMVLSMNHVEDRYFKRAGGLETSHFFQARMSRVSVGICMYKKVFRDALYGRELYVQKQVLPNTPNIMYNTLPLLYKFSPDGGDDTIMTTLSDTHA